MSINQFFNQIPRERDLALWGIQDYWTTPDELMSLSKGDCEDLAIAKYFVLRQLGVSEQKINMAYGKSFDTETGILEPHMVLIYYSNKKNLLILDSLKTSLTRLDKRTDLMLEYSFNTESLWRIQDGHKGQLMGRADNIKRWSNLLKRM
ncbi:MAG: transglutaminase-like cysteine peptidase [Gammaproteobacteria bacterium]|nr:transglutaminase-like cysteine peptidase [Gammaproteobacteria bacterium]